MVNRLRQLMYCLLFLLCLLSGCAREPQGEARLFWPIPPDGPRLEFVGRYRAIADFPHNKFSRLLEKFEGKENEPAVLEKPRGLFVAGEKIFIADEALRNVIVFNLKERSINALFTEGVLRAPLDITADTRGNFYVSDAEFGKILIFTPEGTYIRAIGSPESLRRPVHLAINEKLQRIYATDVELNRVVVFALSGELLFSFGAKGDGRGEFRRPQGLAFDKDGNLFVADSGNARIQIFAEDGAYLDQFGQRGNTVRDLREPVDLTFDSEGNLHILDKGMFAMMSYSPKGKVLLATGSGARSPARMGFANPAAIAINGNDRIFISDIGNNSVTSWQFLNAAYLSASPIRKEDYLALADHLGKTTADTVAINEEDIHHALNKLAARLTQETNPPIAQLPREGSAVTP